MLKAVNAAAIEPDHTKRVTRLRATLDLEPFISLTALDVLMWNWDGYAMNRNNYRLFHDLDSNRLVFFPHGVDQMFWKRNGPIVTGRSGLVVKSLLETAEGRRLYLERFAQLRATVFDVKAVTNEIARLTARLHPALAKNGVAEVARQQSSAMVLRNRIVVRARDVDQQLVGVKNLLQLELNEAVPLTNWIPRQEFGRVLLDKTADAPASLHLKVNNETSFGAWNTTVWLEEGRYRLEGRVRSRGVRGAMRDESVGAGFRVWSDRKDTKGASWGWFPYGNSIDRELGGLIPVMTDTVEMRLTRDTDWTAVTHEFELRQPIADLQIQCALQASAGEAWFDSSSIKIRRLSFNVSKVTGVRGE
jgi:hypothetical protein